MSDDHASTEDLISFEELVGTTVERPAVAKAPDVRSPWPSLESANPMGRPGSPGAATATQKE